MCFNQQVISDHADVAEVAVVAVRDPLKGHIPLGLLVLNASCSRPHDHVIQVCSCAVCFVCLFFFWFGGLKASVKLLCTRSS